jgi:hypothetical protein
VNTEHEELLRRLALNDEGAAAATLGTILGRPEASGQDAKTTPWPGWPPSSPPSPLCRPSNGPWRPHWRPARARMTSSACSRPPPPSSGWPVWLPPRPGSLSPSGTTSNRRGRSKSWDAVSPAGVGSCQIMSMGCTEAGFAHERVVGSRGLLTGHRDVPPLFGRDEVVVVVVAGVELDPVDGAGELALVRCVVVADGRSGVRADVAGLVA